jgi:hypothetical protein
VKIQSKGKKGKAATTKGWVTSSEQFVGRVSPAFIGIV